MIPFCAGYWNTWFSVGLPKGSAFGIRHLLKKVDENFLMTKGRYYDTVS